MTPLSQGEFTLRHMSDVDEPKRILLSPGAYRLVSIHRAFWKRQNYYCTENTLGSQSLELMIKERHSGTVPCCSVRWKHDSMCGSKPTELHSTKSEFYCKQSKKHSTRILGNPKRDCRLEDTSPAAFCVEPCSRADLSPWQTLS